MNLDCNNINWSELKGHAKQQLQTLLTNSATLIMTKKNTSALDLIKARIDGELRAVKQLNDLEQLLKEMRQ